MEKKRNTTPQLQYTISLAGQQLTSFAQAYPRESAFKHYAERLLHYTSQQGFFTLCNEWLAEKWQVSVSTVRRIIKRMSEMGLVKVFSRVRTRDRRNPRGWYHQRIIVFDSATVRVRYATQRAQKAYERFEQDVLLGEASPSTQKAVQDLGAEDRQVREQVVRAFTGEVDVPAPEMEQARREVAAVPNKNVLNALFLRSPYHMALLLKLACTLQHQDAWESMPKDAAAWLQAGATYYQERLHLGGHMAAYMRHLSRPAPAAHIEPEALQDHSAETEALLAHVRHLFA